MITLGAMSGTSTDGIDVAALELIEGRFHFLGVHSEEFTPELRARLLQIQEVPWRHAGTAQSDALTELLLTRKALSEAYVSSCMGLLDHLSLDNSKVSAVGVHGQTLRHRPDLGFTYQMIDPALVATRLGIDVVSDFRSKDVALGGQGAPLVPAFHEAWVRSSGEQGDVAVLNLGGFSNLTVLGSDGSVVGGDCGPANVWMDHVARLNWGHAFDPEGKWARSGQLNKALLNELMSHSFFSKKWPKSTGRDDFTVEVLNTAIQAITPSLPQFTISSPDLMNTLAEVCAQSITDCLKPYCVTSLWVCGGGAFNTYLLERIDELLNRRTSTRSHPVKVAPMDQLGLPVMAVEATAFAWLAARFLNRRTGNSIGVTGASQPAVLGSLTLAY